MTDDAETVPRKLFLVFVFFFLRVDILIESM